MAKLYQLKPLLLNADFNTGLAMVQEYGERRRLDMLQPNHYVKKARVKAEGATARKGKDKKIAVTIEQLALLQKMGLV